MKVEGTSSRDAERGDLQMETPTVRWRINPVAWAFLSGLMVLWLTTGDVVLCLLGYPARVVEYLYTIPVLTVTFPTWIIIVEDEHRSGRHPRRWWKYPEWFVVVFAAQPLCLVAKPLVAAFIAWPASTGGGKVSVLVHWATLGCLIVLSRALIWRYWWKVVRRRALIETDSGASPA